ncbi:MAG: methyltransferase domain-containing protein [Alphaproteobacteria bacterium]|nr:methyltransferase domain-containing protein [Alphaproteobacteria bacterium]
MSEQGAANRPPGDPGLNGRSFTAAQAFLLEAKLRWTHDLFPRLRAKAEAYPEAVEGVAAILESDPDYRIFAWLERHLQRFKYSGRYGLQVYHAAHREGLEASLNDRGLPDGMLTLDPDLEMPRYYTSTDIHQHPGGVWSDPIAGYVYERGARSTTPTLGAKHPDLHTRFTDQVAALMPVPPGTIFDMACGFGKSTLPFAEAYPDAEIIAMDLSEPCLRLGAHTAANAQRRNVRFVQGDATESGLEDESQDLVTSTMYLHEMPPNRVEKALQESFRVLKPGGRMAHLDFYHLPDAFARFIHYGHGRRNNEPFMQPLAEMDLPTILTQIGFTDIEIEPFEESPGALAAENRSWRFPWTTISAAKPG